MVAEHPIRPTARRTAPPHSWAISRCEEGARPTTHRRAGKLKGRCTSRHGHIAQQRSAAGKSRRSHAFRPSPWRHTIQRWRACRRRITVHHGLVGEWSWSTREHFAHSLADRWGWADVQDAAAVTMCHSTSMRKPVHSRARTRRASRRKSPPARPDFASLRSACP